MPQMKIYPIIATLLGCMAIETGHAQQKQDSALALSLDQCVQYAYQNSPTIAAKRAR